STFVVAAARRAVVAIGLDEPDRSAGSPGSRLRDAAACFARAVSTHAEVAGVLPTDHDQADAAHAVVEGVLLARYRYDALRTSSDATPLERLVLVAEATAVEHATAGARRGQVFAAATTLARDLANTPHSHLTAT